jgi:uncharacterized protein YkwD
MGSPGRRTAAVVALLACLGPLTWAAGAAEVRKSSSVEKSIRECANRERSERGLHRLRHDHALDRAAELHARRMLAKGFFDHRDPAGNGPADRVKRFARRRYVIVGENIAAGFDSIRTTCREWMRSRTHRAVILRPRFTRIGAGYASGDRHSRHYYVQVLADVP